MPLIRRSAATGALLLSLLGLLLCVAGIVGVWAGKSRLDEVSAALFAAADEAFDHMDSHLERVSHALEESRRRATEVSTLAGRLEAAGDEVRKELEPLLLIVDDIFARLKSARQWLESNEAVARGVHRVSAAIATSQEESSSERSSDSTPTMAQRVAEFSETVADALARLQAMRQELVDLREKRILSRELAALIVSRVADLEERLANLAQRIDTFTLRIHKARANCTALGERVHWWVNMGGVIIVLILLWFGISQIGMMKHASHFARLRSTMA